jgi:ATP-dependent exoDNAse (exonuclease V) alpha subunit
VRMVRAAASSSDRVVCVVGHAGAGKTTALAALAEAFQREGKVVIGAAPSGVAAAKLAEETGIPSATLHRVLAEAHGRGGLPRLCLLIVDEAGMADTRTLTRMLFQVEHAGGKAVLVGDPAQLPAVGAGGLFTAIVERNGAIELTDNRRQVNELEQRALARLREGAGPDYLTHAAEQGRLVVAGTAVEAKAQLVADWWRAARDDLGANAMIAYRRADVAELNDVARAILDREGRLGRERIRLANGLELAVGDRVLCTRNDRQLGVVNGTRGSVIDVNEQPRSIVLELTDHGRLELPAHYVDAGHVSHAYALTGHKTQGLTVEQAFVLAPGHGQLREWGYVALSRSRQPARVYTTGIELDPDAPPHRPEPAGPLDRLAEAFTLSAAETLAIDTARPGDGNRLADRLRGLSEQRRRLEKGRMQAARRLHQTKEQLPELGPVRRARQGRRLREQIGQRRQELAALESELDRLKREQRALAAQLREIRRIERPARGHERVAERSRERGLSLGL